MSSVRPHWDQSFDVPSCPQQCLNIVVILVGNIRRRNGTPNQYGRSSPMRSYPITGERDRVREVCFVASSEGLRTKVSDFRFK